MNTYRKVIKSAKKVTEGWRQQELFIPVSLAVAGLLVVTIAFASLSFSLGVESTSTIVRNLGLLVAAIVALPIALWRSMVASTQTQIAHQTLLNDRYQKAAEMLGGNNLFTRLGGIHGLRSLIEEHPERYYIQSMRLLCEFVRTPPKDEHIPPTYEESYGDRPSLRQDVQAIMDIMRIRDDKLTAIERENNFSLDFRGARLSGAELRRMNLSWTWLVEADLSYALLEGSNLSNAMLWNSNLRNARLSSTNLKGTMFHKTDLSDAQFSEKIGPTRPARGITTRELSRSLCQQGHPPLLVGVLDADSGQPLEWKPATGIGTEYPACTQSPNDIP